VSASGRWTGPDPAGPRGSRRAWGWHRLTDEWAARIVAEAGIRPGELVLDIGAGEGALTASLIKAGARVVAVELHPGRAARLRRRFADDTGVGYTGAGDTDAGDTDAGHTGAGDIGAGHTGGGVTVVHGDAASLRLPGRPFRVVASPPYGMTARLLGVLLAPGSRLVAADLVLQRAAVRKYAEAPRSRARGYRVSGGMAVPRRAFRPPPQVDSAVLVVRRR
jgi:23S rRNA (adenine-N6)-dimethyltransferase